MNDAEDRMIEQTLWMDARPETVWRFFTDPARLAQWWGRAELDARPGGVLRVSMQEGRRPVMRGEFVELVPYERIVFTFGWEATPSAPDIPPGSTRVEVTLTADGGGTRLNLQHNGLPPALGTETSDGWAYVLDLLRKAATSHREQDS
ncbi:SRPBCC family protein [Actinomadura alba]|uniref:SRPBCC domain-containing protein n=1 Tax=Actinomadura alba TaxID=406431 RepID=A0ABR7LSH0_9ACTN|nr:SRPBCC family protein [Actinomadura alba]MBC6467425.1 SRPBCC domain-containing protein [Actinomadura alba]